MPGRAPVIDAIVRGPKLFRQGIRTMSELLVGDPVGLFREPDNPADSNAVFVTNKDEKPFGYIQREKASELALWMDRGWVYSAKVIRAPHVLRKRGLIGVKTDDCIVRCTPIPPAVKKTDISAFTDLLKSKELVD